MKKKLVIIMLLIGLLAGCSKVTCENEEELYIEFGVEEIHSYRWEQLNLLSPNIIVDTNGEVSYQGDTVYPVEGEYEVTYVVTSLEDPSKTKEYSMLIIIEKYPSFLDENGHVRYAIYKTTAESFENVETRFVLPFLTEGNTGWLGISQYEVAIILEGPKITIVRGDLEGIRGTKWVGEYTLMSDDQWGWFHVTNLHNEVRRQLDPDTEPPELEEGVYEAYFYIPSLDKVDDVERLYYFMEFPIRYQMIKTLRIITKV